MTPPQNGFRTFVIVWLTQSVSVIGSSITLFAVTIWLTQTLYPLPEQKGELAFALSALGLSFAFPTVFAAPLAGTWADRHDRKRTMVVADFLNAGLSLLLMTLVASGTLQLWPLLVITTLFAIIGAFHSAAFDTSYAMLVPSQQLPRANGMMQSTWSLAGILAPALAASIIALPALARDGRWAWPGEALARLSDGAALVMALDAFTFLLGGVVLLFVHIPSPKRADLAGDGAQPKTSVWADIRAGVNFIWQRRPLLWLLGTFTLINLAATPLMVLAPVFTKFNLAVDWTSRGLSYEAALAALNTVGSVGGVVGGIALSVWGGLKTRRIYGVLIPIFLSGVIQVVYGLTPFLLVAAAMSFFHTMMIPIMNSHSQTIWQTQTPHELQGRVFAVRRLIAQFTFPLANVLAGWAGGVFDVGVFVAVLGGLLSILCFFQFFNPTLLRVEDKVWLDKLAAQPTNVEVGT